MEWLALCFSGDKEFPEKCSFPTFSLHFPTFLECEDGVGALVGEGFQGPPPPCMRYCVICMSKV